MAKSKVWTNDDKMSRKFLFCFPLRAGNIVFGYILIIISIAVVAYHLYRLCRTWQYGLQDGEWDKFGKWQSIQYLDEEWHIVYFLLLLYYLTYVAIGMLLFLFAILFTCGASKANHCLVSSFFAYSFIHLFLSIGLMVWEATSDGWIQLGLIVAFNLLLVLCLFSVQYLKTAIRSGHIYSRPGEVLYKY